jgi:hypothetical protein
MFAKVKNLPGNGNDFFSGVAGRGERPQKNGEQKCDISSVDTFEFHAFSAVS